MAESSHAFLLRCWKEPNGEGELAWRFSLVTINEKGEKKGFASLEAVVDHLRQVLASIERDVPEGKHP